MFRSFLSFLKFSVGFLRRKQFSNEIIAIDKEFLVLERPNFRRNPRVRHDLALEFREVVFGLHENLRSVEQEIVISG